MNKVTSFLSVVLCIALTSVKLNGDLKIDWKKITDKDHIVTYVKVVYDSSSQYAIDTKVRIYNTNDGARTFSKKSAKLLKKLIMDPSNFTESHEDTGNHPVSFTNAIVVTRNGDIQGIINIAGNEKLWMFEPKCNAGEWLVLNEKGSRLKEKIFESIK